MSPLERKRPQDEEREVGAGSAVDLDARACPRCRRELPSWVERCPDDGAGTVRLEDLPPPTDPLLERFLTEEESDGRRS